MNDQSLLLRQHEQDSFLADEPTLDDPVLFLRQGDWQWNAAVCGFINIIGEKNVTFDESGDVHVCQGMLDGFAEKYFRYFINTYFMTFSLNRILQFKTTLDRHEDGDFEDFGLKDLKDLNAYIRDVIKKYLKSNSYVKALARMDAGPTIAALEKRLSTLREPKDDAAFAAAKGSLLPDVREHFLLLRQVIEICGSVEAKREIGARNAIYTVINLGWGGVSFLNRQTTEKDVYADYRNYFVVPALDDLHSDHSKYQFRCFSCGVPMKNVENDLSFLTATGFDANRKSSHVWNFSNDIAVCPLCRLVYSCLPAGISYAFDKGIYINVRGIEQAWRVNTHICRDILSEKQKGISIYRVLMQALQKQVNSGYQYDMADVQVVRLENEKYHFNVLSRRMIEVIVQSEKDLGNLMNVFFTQDGVTYQVYGEVADRIFESRNLFSLLHTILYSRLNTSNRNNCRSKHVLQLLQINQRLLKKLGGVQEMSDEMVRSAQKAGYFLRRDYDDKGAKDKIPGICYRLLNALKTGNSNMFLDVALNCYLYVGKPVPRVFIDVMGKDAEFSTMGYAFVSGLIMDKGASDKATDDGVGVKAENNESQSKNEEEAV